MPSSLTPDLRARIPRPGPVGRLRGPGACRLRGPGTGRLRPRHRPPGRRAGGGRHRAPGTPAPSFLPERTGCPGPGGPLRDAGTGGSGGVRCRRRAGPVRIRHVRRLLLRSQRSGRAA